MAGTFPGVSGTQQNDVYGAPLAGGVLSVFNGGTNDLSTVYQDIGLAILGSNPMTADDSGRLPLFFVADGTYKVRLVDQYGSIANGGFEYPQCPSIGASSSGGGGTAVDPTTIASTGDIKGRVEDGIISGWVRMNARTIGNAVSGASERASADCQALFVYLYGFSDTICPVSGGRTGNALNDFNAGKQITLLDARFRAFIGLDTMGSSAAGRSTGALFLTGSAILPASTGGEAAHTSVIAEAAAHDHGGATGVDSPDHSHTYTYYVGVQNMAPGGNALGTSVTSGTTSGASTRHTHSIPSTGSGSAVPHNTTMPFFNGSWYMKL